MLYGGGAVAGHGGVVEEIWGCCCNVELLGRLCSCVRIKRAVRGLVNGGGWFYNRGWNSRDYYAVVFCVCPCGSVRVVI